MTIEQCSFVFLQVQAPPPLLDNGDDKENSLGHYYVQIYHGHANLLALFWLCINMILFFPYSGWRGLSGWRTNLWCLPWTTQLNDATWHDTPSLSRPKQIYQATRNNGNIYLPFTGTGTGRGLNGWNPPWSHPSVHSPTYTLCALCSILMQLYNWMCL